jgi:phosphoribosyl 1,2-cyclic phosphate phosphodiesterase
VEIGREIAVEGDGGTIRARPLLQQHGDIPSIGWRFGNLAYSPDVSDISEETAHALEGLDIWIVDALRFIHHPAHFTVRQALEWIERLKPKRAILTHLHVDLDYEALRRELPSHVQPAYDGMTVEFDAG